jgi:hypothetical protein
MDLESVNIPDLAQQTYQVPRQMYNSNMVILTNPEPEIYKLSLLFRGLEQDNNGNMIRISNPKVNELGLSSILTHLRSAVAQIGILGHIEKKDLSALQTFFADGLIRDLMVHRLAYNMSYEDRDVIFRACIRFVNYALRRSMDNEEKGFWGRITNEFKTIVEASNKKKDSGFLGTGMWKQNR